MPGYEKPNKKFEYSEEKTTVTTVSEKSAKLKARFKTARSHAVPSTKRKERVPVWITDVKALNAELVEENVETHIANTDIATWVYSVHTPKSNEVLAHDKIEEVGEPVKNEPDSYRIRINKYRVTVAKPIKEIE